MRTARLKADGAGYYHCLSRIVDRQMRLGEQEQEKFRVLLRQMAAFCGVHVLTYAIMQKDGAWRELVALYRRQLFAQGAQGTKKQPATFSPEQAQKVLDEGGQLARHELLRCRVRYFTDGVVLGNREFVESVFARHRHLFGPKRRTGARKLRYGDWGGLCTVRDLRLAAISVPALSG